MLPPGYTEWQYVKVRGLFVPIKSQRLTISTAVAGSRHLQRRRLPRHIQRWDSEIQHASRGVRPHPSSLLPQRTFRLSPSLFSPPPREQSKFERWSLVFFTRPDSSVGMRALTEQSPLIADAVAKASHPEAFDPNSNAGEWFARRIKNQRIKNRTVSDIRLMACRLSQS